MTLPALGNSLLKAIQTIQYTSVVSPEPLPSYNPYATAGYMIGILKGYEQGYTDGLHAFEPLVPSGFKTPYLSVVKMLLENSEARKGLQKLLSEIYERIPSEESNVNSGVA